MIFAQKLDNIIDKNNSLLCVGLDSNFDKIPAEFKSQDHPQFLFNKYIIDQTHELVCAYKPNSAFYESRGAQGVVELKMTCDYIREHHPEIVIILDAKRGDIGSTNDAYADYIFNYLRADAITIQPYLGKEANESFLNMRDKGVIILCRTSNPGSGEFQDLNELYKTVARNIVTNWNTNGNCMLVVGATYPEELAEIRAIAGDMTFLVPGIGAQGGDIEKTVKAGLNSHGKGIMINSSRGIIFAENPQKEAEKLKDEINQYR